jgi:hypothetical protein
MSVEDRRCMEVLHNSGQSNLDKKELVETPVRWIEEICNENQLLDFDQLSGEKFITILNDLCLYEKQELKDLSFNLLCDYFKQQEKMVEGLKDIQVIESQEQIDKYSKIKQCLSEFQVVAEDCENWYPLCQEEEGKNYDQTQKLISICE